jgi:signal transduction histidine kinase
VLLLSVGGIEEEQRCELEWQELHGTIDHLVQQLEQRSNSAVLPVELKRFLQHTAIIKEKQRSLQEVLIQLLTLDSSQRLEQIRLITLEHFNVTKRYQNTVEMTLFIVANILVLYVVSLLIKLARTVREVELANIMLEKASRAKNDFLATMSHELRTPLYGVMGMTELLQESSLSTEQKDWANTIYNSSELLLEIIGDMLDLSRIEEGMFNIMPVRFELEDALHDIVNIMRIKAHEKSLDLQVALPKKLPRYFIGDRARIRQIILNLVSNAVKFTEKGHVKITVEWSNQGANLAKIIISVEDTGIGIPEDKLDYIFNKFTQVEESDTRTFGGTGLGLALCKQLCSLMGGSISVRSTLGKGSTFYVCLDLPYEK